jgi:hypothetical protein
MEAAFLMPGQERWTPVCGKDGKQKIAYSFCSLQGHLFSCVCRDLDEAQSLCEDWLLAQDRNWRN